MNETIVKNVLICLPWGTAALTGALVLCLAAGRKDRLLLQASEEFAGLLRERGKRRKWYQRQERWLKRNGAEFHYGSLAAPIPFLAVKICLALAGFAAGLTFSVGYGCLGALVFYLVPGILLEYLNKRDNAKMLPEIKMVYHNLAMQIRAGIYITDALAECYSGLQERRLYQGFLDLAGEIAMKADIFQALELFQAKFDNRYIDSLCITILQALESGQAVELLNDIGGQIRDMEVGLLEKKKSSLDRSLTFYQLGILAAILGIALYACVTYLFGQALQF